MKYCRVPSPIGHALAGIAAGWLVAPGRGSALGVQRSGYRDVGLGTRDVGRLALFAAAGIAPDLDLLVGAHSGPTHGVGAAVIVCAAAWILARSRTGARQPAFALAVAAAYATHILLDWLGSDTSAPIGIMALWPFSHAYYESPAHIFMAISRRYWLPEFWAHNLRAVGRELVILVPIGALVMWIRRRGIS